MEIRNSKNLYSQNSFSEINDKYTRIIDKGNQFAYQMQRMRQDDQMFRTQSKDSFEGTPGPELGLMGGSLFISGSSAPV